MNANTLQQIREHMPVVCSNGVQFGVSDQIEGQFLKLTAKDSPDGQHHWIPLEWVTSVDDKIHVDRPGEQAMREWLTKPPVPTGVS
jgi:hypothetical protein